MSHNERIFESLMSTLQRLAADTSIDQVAGQKRAIWDCISKEVPETDRVSFIQALRKKGREKEKQTPDDRNQERLFWREVAHTPL